MPTYSQGTWWGRVRNSKRNHLHPGDVHVNLLQDGVGHHRQVVKVPLAGEVGVRGWQMETASQSRKKKSEDTW